MEALEKAKLALRKFILKNKEKVSNDLNELRAKSTGDDIFKYVENLSGSFVIEEAAKTKVKQSKEEENNR